MHLRRTTRPLFFLSAAALALAASRLAAAEPPPTQMSPFKVGAEDARLQNSVSTLGSYLLEQHGVAQLQDAAGIAPNLFLSNSDSRGFGDVLALRGSANSIFFTGPSVALLVDDVPAGSVSAYPSSLLNIESFVVKAGPHGTSSGRNAAAGVIDIRTRVPGARHQGRIAADYGSFNATSLQAAFDGPINSQAGYSASFGYQAREGYLDNTFLKRSADDRRSWAGRGALYFTPDPTLRLRIGGLVARADDDATRLSSLASRDPFKVASDLNGETSLDRRQGSFQARKKFAGGTLIATSSWQHYEVDPAETDLDLNPIPAALSRVAQTEELWTQEVRFESEPAADKGQWRAGLFYLKSDIASTAVRTFIVPPAPPFVPPNFVQTERSAYTIGQMNFAGYASFDQPLAPGLTAEIGARAERTRSELARTKASTNSYGFPTPQDRPLSLRDQNQYVSVSGGLEQVISDALSVRVRTSLAHRPAGHSGFTGTPALAQFGAEKTWANEAGLAFGAPKGRLSGSVLVFWNKVDDYQFERTVPNSTDFVVVNADEVESRGVEAKLMWRAADHVWWDFQAGTTDAKFRRHRTAAGVNASDRRVPFIPAATLRTGVTVDFGGGFSGNASYGLVGRTYYDELNSAATSQARYGSVNAQLRYRHGRWTTTVYGLNLADKNYYQFINAEIFAGSPGAPRRLGVQVAFEY